MQAHLLQAALCAQKPGLCLELAVCHVPSSLWSSPSSWENHIAPAARVPLARALGQDLASWVGWDEMREWQIWCSSLFKVSVVLKVNKHKTKKKKKTSLVATCFLHISYNCVLKRNKKRCSHSKASIRSAKLTFPLNLCRITPASQTHRK